ncbi:uncharacterized protein LOC129881982 [Solanum dulcamara]|uniref:uncharacterized protein LOC129881982 n=1 Tax=Solanum dulcamara TaxID=45834 RepID=UPI0024855D00|nr:uncharacterized protein LOC129881982 [Solanum dulcamara]
MWCEVCGSSEHVAEHYGANLESINFVGNAPKGVGNQNYGNTYNPNWRNHPNFSWGGNQQNYHHGPTQYRPQGSGHQYNNPSQGYNAQIQIDQASTKSGSMSVEDMLKQIMIDQAKLASDVNVVTTHSGRPLTELAPKAKLAEEKGKEQVQINLPLIDVLRGIPKYAKFVRDIVANKSKLAEFATVALTEECSSRILNKSKLPTKLKDPGSFTVQVTIGKYSNARGLCDLGASINLMPRSMLKKLGLGELKATTILLQLADRSVARPDGIIEDVLVQVGSLIFHVDFVVLDFEPDPDVPFILGRPFLATGGALIDVAAGRLTMRTHDKVEVFDVYHALKLPAIYEELSAVTIIDEEISAQCTTSNDPLAKVVMGQDIAEDMEAKELASVLDMPNINMWKKNVEPLNRELGPSPKPSLEEAPKLELKKLPAYLRYVFLGINNTLPIILSSALSEAQVLAALEVLKRHKKAIGWQMADLHGISPTLCMHRIFMKEGHKASAQPQRRLNPIMKEVKGGMTVITNEKNELIPTRTVTGWRICMDYRKLNDATRKDHYPVPFIDQMLDRLAGQEYYCFLDGYSGYNQITIAPEDQEKTTFTCPYGTYAFKRMPFGLCNAPATFQRCMIAIFHDMVEDFVEVFMDDFSVFGESFDLCLKNLEKVLARCEETNLVLNWEKCHFLVKEGIVLGHKVSKDGLEVDKAKIEVIEKLSPPISVKGVRSFLGHAGFYRRFIKDFSKIAKPMCGLLEKEVKFVFDDECLQAFELLKKKLIEAPILLAPNWELPFVLMCDASDTAVGAVLGQRKEKIFHSIYYASKTLDSTQANNTVTEKEMLALVYAFDKFRSYLVGTKVIVFTDHAALRYLFNKKDAKPRLIRWILLLQEFDIEIKDRRGCENQIADHLSRLEGSPHVAEQEPIKEEFPDEQLLEIEVQDLPWYADIVNYLVSGVFPPDATSQQKKKLMHDVRLYI